ncbi:MAG: PTS system mannose/fructose/sorbose family transporter subunit IID [bacterium]
MHCKWYLSVFSEKLSFFLNIRSIMQLGFFRLIRLFFTSLFLQSSWSFYSMQSLGFLFTARSGLDKNRNKKLLQNGRFFFNTHPYMAGYIIGAVLRAYEKDEDLEKIKNYINVGQSAFASAGDTLFWQTIRPALLLLAIIFGLKFGIVGPLIFIFVYNIIHLYHRFAGFIAGYKQGWDIIYILKTPQFTLMQKLFENLGAFFVGLVPIVLQKNYHILLLIPLMGIFLIFLWKKISPIIILTFVFILIIINLLIGR